MEVQELITKLSKPVKNSLYFEVLHDELKKCDKDIISLDDMNSIMNTLAPLIPEHAHASIKEEITSLYSIQA